MNPNCIRGLWKPDFLSKNWNSVYYSIKNDRAPKGTTIFFVGDDVSDYNDELVKELSNPRNICDLLSKKSSPDTNIFVITPNHYAGPFACFDHFIPSMTATGEPKSYLPREFPACSYLISHLSSAIAHALRPSYRKNDTLFADEEGGSISFFGFSKGGIVLNQIMAELAYSVNTDSKSQSIVFNTTPSPPHRSIIFPSSIAKLLSALKEFHFIDAGLSTTGCYLTDPSTLHDLTKFAASREEDLRIVLHGTPRQWCDPRRPWIFQEKERFMHLLQNESQLLPNEKLLVEERWYFKGKAPNLRMHFEIIRDLDMS